MATAWAIIATLFTAGFFIGVLTGIGLIFGSWWLALITGKAHLIKMNTGARVLVATAIMWAVAELMSMFVRGWHTGYFTFAVCFGLFSLGVLYGTRWLEPKLKRALDNNPLFRFLPRGTPPAVDEEKPVTEASEVAEVDASR